MYIYKLHLLAKGFNISQIQINQSVFIHAREHNLFHIIVS